MNRSTHRLLAAGFAACTLLGLGGAARAQYAFYEDDAILPPRAVAWQLADRGFSGIGRPRFDGRAYVVEAFAPNGARVRLFVDAADGAILDRQRLDAPPAALARPMPGYGWTEEDEAPRRPMRQAERMVPPADIPMPESRGVAPRRGYEPGSGPAHSDGAIGPPNRAGIEPNPNGLNPDPRPRSDTPRKLARVGTPALKGSEPKASETKAARTVPEAPQLKSPETAKGASDKKAASDKVDAGKGETPAETKPDASVAAVEPPKPAPAVPSTPAAVQPPAEGTVAAKPAEAAPAAKPLAQAWKDPPDGKRPVRVIGGATMVPGQAEAKPNGTP